MYDWVLELDRRLAKGEMVHVMPPLLVYMGVGNQLLVIWRFFRLWALLDGIDTPENMVRCMANNYSTLGFWRSWHRSYNLWLLRYDYSEKMPFVVL